MSDEYKEQFMQKELHDIISAISQAGRKDQISVKALERQKKNIEERLEKLLSSPKDSSLCFESWALTILYAMKHITIRTALFLPKCQMWQAYRQQQHKSQRIC